MWPNPHHIPHEEYQANLQATSVSEGSDDTFANTIWTPGLSSPAPNFNSLSPQPPRFQSVEEEQQNQIINHTIDQAIQSVNERIERGHTIAEELLNTISRVQQSQGTELDQFAFREGRLTYCQLQAIDRINNPQFYSEPTETAVAGSSSQFREDDQHQEGEVQEEQREEEVEPLPHHLHTLELMQLEDTSNETQISGESSTTSIKPQNLSGPIETPIIQFLNEEDWTLWLNGQLDRIFQ